jgi:rod shape-determining protein MreD
VRRAWLAALLLAVAMVLQLTVLNGLRLPGIGVPDLVLVLVAVLAMAAGPVPGMVIGFAAGLCLDIAPPGSELIGQYALVFCLAGWAAGRLSGAVHRSPLRALALVAVVVAVAEALTAALGLVLEPAQVTTAEVRQILPATIGYDLLLCPFALYLVAIASTRLAPRLGASAAMGLSTVPARSQRSAQRKYRPHVPRLREAAARTSDGWVGGGPGSRHHAHPRARRPARLHPANGVAGSASGLVLQRPRPVTPLNLRLTSGRRGDAAIGNRVGIGQGQHWQPSRHPGLLAGSSGRFRPHGGELGGSARRPALARLQPGRAPERARINFSAHRGDASIGRRLGTSWLSMPRGTGAHSPRLRMGASRAALSVPGRTALAAAVPTVRFRSSASPLARRPVATPKFRSRAGLLRRSALTTGLLAGGVLDQSTFRARRARASAPRLRLAGAGRSAGMLGGSGRSPLRRPPVRLRKQPRFGYGRRSVLSFLTGRHIGGQWLASKRVGSRSGVWLIGRRAGGVR